jgi:predicted RNase H-like nuclease (RuvC/YqgF family)
MTLDPSLDYFEEYREKLREIKSLEKQISDLHAQMHSKRSMVNTLSSEIESMRRIITVMIDRGMDPVEAKLKTDDEEREANLWRDHGIDRVATMTAATGGAGSVSITDLSWPSTIVTSAFPSSAITNTGAISALGSMRITGATGSYAPVQRVSATNDGIGY